MHRVILKLYVKIEAQTLFGRFRLRTPRIAMYHRYLLNVLTRADAVVPPAVEPCWAQDVRGVSQKLRVCPGMSNANLTAISLAKRHRFEICQYHSVFIGDGFQGVIVYGDYSCLSSSDVSKKGLSSNCNVELEYQQNAVISRP